MQSPEINPHIYGQSIFTFRKVVKTLSGEKMVSLTKVLGPSTWIIELTKRAETVKLLEDHENRSLWPWVWQSFLTNDIKEQKEMVHWNSSRVKAFVLQRTSSRKWKGSPEERLFLQWWTWPGPVPRPIKNYYSQTDGILNGQLIW